MRKVFAATVVAFLAAFGLALTSSPASAVATSDCRTVTVNLTDRNDTGSDGTVWAKDALTRTLKVCVEAAPAVTADASNVLYSATVTDNGTFVTVAGKSPYDGVDILPGIEGAVKGGFEVANFSAPMWDDSFKLTAPGQKTSSGEWVNAAFPGAKTSITKYAWTYTTACEEYVDNNGVYTGDITSKCVEAKAPTVTDATCNGPGELVIPTATGVKYTAGTKENGKIVVTAKAKPGYKLVGDTKWTLTIPAQLPADSEQCKEPTTPPTTPPATNDPGTGGGGTVSPTPSESSVVAAPPMNNSGSELPVTGSSKSTMLYLLGGGLMLVAIGGGAVLYARRNRDEVEFTS